MEHRRHLPQHCSFASLCAAASQDAGELEGCICSQIAGAVVGSDETAMARNDWRETKYTLMV